MGTAIKHPVSDRVKSAICNFWHPGTLTLRAERQSARMSKITNDRLNPAIWNRMLYSCSHMATADVKGLISLSWVYMRSEAWPWSWRWPRPVWRQHTGSPRHGWPYCRPPTPLKTPLMLRWLTAGCRRLLTGARRASARCRDVSQPGTRSRYRSASTGCWRSTAPLRMSAPPNFRCARRSTAVQRWSEVPASITSPHLYMSTNATTVCKRHYKQAHVTVIVKVKQEAKLSLG